MSRNVPSRCIFFLSTRSAELRSLSRTKTCMSETSSRYHRTGRSEKRGAAERTPLGSAGAARLGLLQVHRGGLALLAAFELEAHLLALVQVAEAGALDGRDMHKHIFRPILRLNEAIALLAVEPLHGSDRHRRPSEKRSSRRQVAGGASNYP